MSGERRGRGRELDVMRHYREQGCVAYRLAWGNADVVALKAGQSPLLVQVKSTAGGAFERFGPRARALLLIEARAAGAQAALAWWPPNRSLTIIASEAWPPTPAWAAEVLAGDVAEVAS
jgi:Holliday junction resolvase